MELGLNNARLVANSLNHRQRRLNRAQWWFAQMRRAVDGARAWRPAPAARPEQTWFADPRLSGRIELPFTPERQVCE